MNGSQPLGPPRSCWKQTFPAKRKKVIDKLAAVLILQGYLDQSRKRTMKRTLLEQIPAFHVVSSLFFFLRSLLVFLRPPFENEFHQGDLHQEKELLFKKCRGAA